MRLDIEGASAPFFCTPYSVSAEKKVCDKSQLKVTKRLHISQISLPTSLCLAALMERGDARTHANIDGTPPHGEHTMTRLPSRGWESPAQTGWRWAAIIGPPLAFIGPEELAPAFFFGWPAFCICMCVFIGSRRSIMAGKYLGGDKTPEQQDQYKKFRERVWFY